MISSSSSTSSENTPVEPKIGIDSFIVPSPYRDIIVASWPAISQEVVNAEIIHFIHSFSVIPYEEAKKKMELYTKQLLAKQNVPENITDPTGLKRTDVFCQRLLEKIYGPEFVKELLRIRKTLTPSKSEHENNYFCYSRFSVLYDYCPYLGLFNNIPYVLSKFASNCIYDPISPKRDFSNQILCWIFLDSFIHGKLENLSYTNLSGSNLPRLNLSKVILFNTNLSYANLSNVDLSYTDLSSTILFRTNLTHSDLSQANLSGINLYGIDLSAAHCGNANLFGTLLQYCNKTSLSGCLYGGEDQQTYANTLEFYTKIPIPIKHQSIVSTHLNLIKHHWETGTSHLLATKHHASKLLIDIYLKEGEIELEELLTDLLIFVIQCNRGLNGDRQTPVTIEEARGELNGLIQQVIETATQQKQQPKVATTAALTTVITPPVLSASPSGSPAASSTLVPPAKKDGGFYDPHHNALCFFPPQSSATAQQKKGAVAEIQKAQPH